MMRGALTALLFVLAAGFAWLAWAPWVPEADAVLHERGVATGIEDRHGGQDTTTFRTESGTEVKITCGRQKTCKREQMEALLASAAPTPLGHYHGKVYEIDGPLDLHVTLADARLEWKFPTVLAIAALGGGLWLVFRPARPAQRPSKRKRKGGGHDSDGGAEWHVGSDGGSSDD